MSSSLLSLAAKRVVGRRSLSSVPSVLQSLRSVAPPSSFTSYPVAETSTLPNGVRVVTEETSDETATVQVWIDAGSRYEGEHDNGVAHFLEHLKFKGTKQRTRVQLESEVENIGGHLNAYTSREQTVYFASVFRKDIPQAMGILSDILQNSTLDTAAIERERDVILREMQEVNSIPEEVVFDRLHETAFRGQALGRPILGSADNVRSITREDLQTYIKRHYTADRFVVVGSGAVDHNELVSLTSDLFGGLPSGPEEPISLQQAVFTGSEIRERVDDMHKGHFAIAFETAGHNDPDALPLMFLHTLLGHWQIGTPGGLFSHSDLVAAVTKANCVEKISPFNTQYSDTGLFGVYVEALPHDLNEAVYQVTNEVTRLGYELSDEQMEVARHQLKSQVMCALDGTTNIADEVGRQTLSYGRRVHPAELAARIDDVDAQAVMNCAQRFLHDQDVAISALGAIHELPDYNYVRRRTYWQRY